MPVFGRKTFRGSADLANDNIFARIGAKYRAKLTNHPFLMFGLPFLTVIVAGSFFLTPATAIRYEKHDRKVRRLTQEEAMGLGKDRRKLDLNEEYYVRDVQFSVRVRLQDFNRLTELVRSDWPPKI